MLIVRKVDAQILIDCMVHLIDERLIYLATNVFAEHLFQAIEEIQVTSVYCGFDSR